MVGKFDGEFIFDGLMFITPIVKLISVNVNFPDTAQNDVLSFRQIKIRHILKCNLEAFRRIKFPSNFPVIWYANSYNVVY